MSYINNTVCFVLVIIFAQFFHRTPDILGDGRTFTLLCLEQCKAEDILYVVRKL